MLAKPVASRTSAKGGVEGEVPGCKLAKGDSAVNAGKALAHALLVPAASLLGGLQQDHQDTVAALQGKLHGVVETARLQGPRHKTVHHGFDGVAQGLPQRNLVVKGDKRPVNPRTDKSVAAHLVKHFHVLALLAVDVWREDHHLPATGILHDLPADALRILG